MQIIRKHSIQIVIFVNTLTQMMFSSLHKRIKLSGKATLLLGVYFIHFAFYQSIVSGCFDSHFLNVKTIFSDSHRSNGSNKNIATFRMLEKHEGPQQTFKLIPEFPTLTSKFFDILSFFNERSVDQVYSFISFNCSDTSSRLYLRDCVFRI